MHTGKKSTRDITSRKSQITLRNGLLNAFFYFKKRTPLKKCDLPRSKLNIFFPNFFINVSVYLFIYLLFFV
jgi:hypothetical protein